MIVQLHFDEVYLAANRERIENGKYEIPRDCACCKARGTVIGHGVRDRTCIGPHTDIIFVRRGLCKVCKTTFTFLPPFARPNSRYAIEAIQDTFMNFVSNDKKTLFHSMPDLKTIKWWPDWKTSNNWLHAVMDKLEGFQFEFEQCHGFEKASFTMLMKQKYLEKVSSSARGIYERLYNGLALLKEKFAAGACLLINGLRFHAGNFFQALFVARVGVMINWNPSRPDAAHHHFHEIYSDACKIT